MVNNPPLPRPTNGVNMLKYIGKGFLPGIPARDLSDIEVQKYGGIKFLLSTGLFAKLKEKKEIIEVDLFEEGEEWQDQEH